MPQPIDQMIFTDNPAIKGREGKYEVVSVDVAKTLKSWKLSLFSFEWLSEDGGIRPMDDLPLKEREKQIQVEKAMEGQIPLPRAVLGIGIMDNIEIGAGREVFLTLAAQGAKTIQVHIPASSKKEFKDFLVG